MLKYFSIIMSIIKILISLKYFQTKITRGNKERQKINKSNLRTFFSFWNKDKPDDRGETLLGTAIWIMDDQVWLRLEVNYKFALWWQISEIIIFLSSLNENIFRHSDELWNSRENYEGENIKTFWYFCFDKVRVSYNMNEANDQNMLLKSGYDVWRV